MAFTLDLDSVDKYDGIGDAMTLTAFIEHCESGVLIDYDGYASELILNNRVVFTFCGVIDGSPLYPSDALHHKESLLKLQESYPDLKISWCNH